MAGEALASGSVKITVQMSAFARSLAKARGMFTRTVTGMTAIGKRLGGGLFRGVVAGTRIARSSLGRLLGTLRRFAGPLALLGGGAAGVGLAAFATVRTFAQFEQGMARVRAVTGATGPEFARLQGQAEELGRTTAFSATQASEAMGNFAIAGFKVNEIMGAMPATLNLAAAGQLDMKTASDITAKILRGMGLEASRTAEVVDVLANAFTTSNTDLVMLGEAFKEVGPVGKAAGKDLTELSSAISVMSNAGIQGGRAGTALRNILLRLQAQPAEVRKAMSQLGISIDDGSGQMVHLAKVIDMVNARTKNMTTIERSAIISKIAGLRAVAGFTAMLDAGGDALRKNESLHQRLGTSQKIADIQLNTLSGSWKLFKSAMEGAMISLGKGLSPILRKVAEAMTKMAPIMGELIRQSLPLINLWGTNLAGSISTVGKFLQENMAQFKEWGILYTEVMSNVGRLIGKGITAAFGVFGTTARGVMDSLVKGITAYLDAWSLLTTRPGQTMTAIWEFFKQGFFNALASIIDGLKTGIATMTAVFVSNWKAAFITLKDIALSFVKLLSATIKLKLGEILPKHLGGGVTDQMKQDVKNATSMFEQQAIGIPKRFAFEWQKSFKSTKGAVSGFIDSFVGNLTQGLRDRGAAAGFRGMSSIASMMGAREAERGGVAAQVAAQRQQKIRQSIVDMVPQGLMDFLQPEKFRRRKAKEAIQGIMSAVTRAPSQITSALTPEGPAGALNLAGALTGGLPGLMASMVTQFGARAGGLQPPPDERRRGTGGGQFMGVRQFLEDMQAKAFKSENKVEKNTEEIKKEGKKHTGLFNEMIKELKERAKTAFS